jgi:hypothetical protein
MLRSVAIERLWLARTKGMWIATFNAKSVVRRSASEKLEAVDRQVRFM